MVRARSRTARLAARCRTWQQHLAIARTARAHLVGVQTLSLKGMARRKKGCRFARSVADDGYGQLVQVLTRQADKRGCAVVQADRFYPWSKTCSDCGAVKTKLPLSEREYTGTTCGLSLDRDVNAAPNLAALARTLRPGAPPGQAVRSLLAA